MEPTNPPPIQPIQQAIPISSFHPNPSGKLPIKRKIQTQTPNLNLTLTHTDDVTTPNPTPFKFPRIWTEPDEIRFLQNLLKNSSQGLPFPRGIEILFDPLMSQPYTKSQLSDKIRRLRKKFRVTSARLSKGLNISLLSQHDRIVYDLSKQLFMPHHQPDHPESKPNGLKPDNLLAVLALPSVVKKNDIYDNVGDRNEVRVGNCEARVMVRVKGGGDVGGEVKGKVVECATKALGDVVDESLKEMKRMVDLRNVEKEVEFEKRWRDQRVAEFDVLAKRLKLIVENFSVVK